MKIAGNSDNCPWDLFESEGLFVKIIFEGGDLFGTEVNQSFTVRSKQKRQC